MTLSRYLDRIAISLSTICIVHCLAMPFVVAMLPVAAITFGSDGHFHALMLWFVVPTSAIGFSLGYRVHRKTAIVVRGAVAVAVLALVALWGHDAWDPDVRSHRERGREHRCSRSRTGGTSAKSGASTTTPSCARSRPARRRRPASSAISCVNSSRCAARCDAQTSCVPCADRRGERAVQRAPIASSSPSHGSSSSRSRGRLTSARAISARRAWP